MYRCILEPRCVRPIAPCCELLSHCHVADELATGLVVLLLQRQRLVEDEPARAGETAHLALLLAAWHQFEFKGLETLHKIMLPATFTCARTATPSALSFLPLKGRGLPRTGSSFPTRYSARTGRRTCQQQSRSNGCAAAMFAIIRQPGPRASARFAPCYSRGWPAHPRCARPATAKR